MNTVRALSVLLVVALLGACATLPPPDEGTRTLLVVAVKTGPGSYGLAYDFLLKESTAKLPVSPQNGVYRFDKLAPGTYTIDRVTVMLGGGAGGATLMGGNQTYPIQPVTFTLKEGTITILPGTISVYQETVDNRTLQGWRWIPTNRTEVLAELAKYDNFSRWKVAE